MGQARRVCVKGVCEGERSDSGLQREHSVRESGTQVYYSVM